MTSDTGGGDVDPSVLRPYVAGLVVDWLADTPSARHRSVEGTLAFVDISGFTSLTERLAQRGKAGAEEMSDLLDAIFAELLGVAYEHGSWLVKWGGDAVLLLFEGDDHAPRAATAAYLMNRTLARVGRLQTSAGAVRLRMSVGLHSGAFDFFLVGSLHHELVIAGPGATVTAQMEGIAEAGEVACSPATAALLPARTLGPTKDGAVLLARSPAVRSELVLRTRDLSTVDIGSCLPAPVRDHVLAGPLDGEHRQVAVAFVEFSGTDALLTEQGPGAAAAAIDHVVSTCQASAAQRGVTFWETDINKDGGKVMLIAGAPASSGGDEDAMLALARDVVDAGGVLDVRVGVNCGRVFSGGFGPPYRRTYSVTGDAINLAARLMARAPRGAVLASATVLSAAKTRYAEEALEPFLVKGKAKPIHASVVGAARHRRDVAAGEVARPLAGRETELHTLRAAAEAARQGAGSIVEIVGDAGIGKSRLVEELCVGLDVPVVSTACDAYHSTSPYAVVRALLQRVLDVDEDADAHRVGEVLAARTRKSAPSVLPWLPLVADVLGAAVPGTVESAALDPRFRKATQERALVDLLRGLLPGAALVVIEDIHLADESSLDVVRTLAAALVHLPWLIVVTRRPGDVLGAAGAAMVTVELSPLTDDAVTALIRDVTDDSPLTPHQLAALAERAGGNPLFLLELAQEAAVAGGLASLPDTVEGVIAAQIDRLPPSERRLLRAAAVVGASVDVDVLAHVVAPDGDTTTVEDLAALAGMLDPEEHGRYRFRHALLRDTAYEGLPYTRRKELHGRAADALLRRGVDDELPILALHFHRAGRHAEAWEHSRLAGRRAGAVYAYAEAADHYERALESSRVVAAPAVDVAEVIEGLADAQMALGEFGRAATTLRAARRTSPSGTLDAARLCHKAAVAAHRSGSYPQALRWLTRADHTLASLPASSATARLRAEVDVERATVRHWQGRALEAIRACDRAVEQAELADARDVVAHALVWRDVCELTLGRGDGSDARRALAIWRELGDRPWYEARTHNEVGIRAYFAGKWDDAREHYEAARKRFDEAGDTWSSTSATGNLAEILTDQGHLDRAEALLRGCLQAWRASGARDYVAFGESLLGRVAARAGKFDEALELLTSARAAFAADGEQVETLEVDARIADCHVLADDPDAGLAVADAAIARAQAQPGLSAQLPSLHRIRGAALAKLGDRAGAHAAFEESLRAGRAREARHEVAFTLMAFTRFLREGGDPVPAALLEERDTLTAELGIVAPTIAAQRTEAEPQGALRSSAGRSPRSAGSTRR